MTFGLVLRTVPVLVLVVSLCVAPRNCSTKKYSSLESKEKEFKDIYRKLFFSRRNRKFPIIPPRLPFRPGSKNISTSTSTTTTAPSTLSPKHHTDDEDPFEISSSVDSPAVFWPVRRKIASRIFNPPTPTSTTTRPLLKLLQPKPTRPAVYSLYGFVPEPSVRRITTTEAPSYVKELYKLRNSKILSKRKHKVTFRLKWQIRCVNSTVTLNESSETLNKLRSKNVISTKKSFRRFRVYRKKGKPDKDYPIYSHIPNTGFVCGEVPGRFADPETGCQVWHLCPGGYTVFRHSFLCPNGTIFNEERDICDWWYNVHCERVC
ncbi:uncharacterized protein LOC143257858 [Tachypleus tridentatus]|uniref:uncharacterized protein LOC143257858 n=1 Tax=Tachypleus tridentatus TaxID=6853 RepID=UPI003FD2F7D1